MLDLFFLKKKIDDVNEGQHARLPLFVQQLALMSFACLTGSSRLF